jgi:hypothetical protein
MWACPNMLIGDVTKSGNVIDIVSCQLLMKLLAIDTVLGQIGQNMVASIQRGSDIDIYREKRE